jgi:hypothetical protein
MFFLELSEFVNGSEYPFSRLEEIVIVTHYPLIQLSDDAGVGQRQFLEFFFVYITTGCSSN